MNSVFQTWELIQIICHYIIFTEFSKNWRRLKNNALETELQVIVFSCIFCRINFSFTIWPVSCRMKLPTFIGTKYCPSRNAQGGRNVFKDYNRILLCCKYPYKSFVWYKSFRIEKNLNVLENNLKLWTLYCYVNLLYKCKIIISVDFVFPITLFRNIQ